MLSYLFGVAGGDIVDNGLRKGLMTDANENPMQLAFSTLLKSNATSERRGDSGSKSKLCPECWGVGGLIMLGCYY